MFEVVKILNTSTVSKNSSWGLQMSPSFYTKSPYPYPPASHFHLFLSPKIP